MPSESLQQLRAENRDLQARLETAEETLRAIRQGEVDAVVVSGAEGDVVYTLEGADEGYRLLVERMAEGALTVNPDGLILFANHQFAAMLELPLERVIGERLQEFVAVEALPVMNHILAARNGARSEVSFRRPVGEFTPAYVSAAPLRIEDMECVSLVVTDLTEQKRTQASITELRQAQEALRQSEERERARATELQTLLEAAPVAVFMARDSECRQVLANRMGHEILRIASGANTSKSAPPGEAPEHFRVFRNGRELAPSELPMQQAAATGHPVHNDELEIVFDDGSRRTVLGDAVPLLGEDGRTRGAVGAFTDITGRKRDQERLRQTQKLESIGLLAGGIAHDFNNLMTGILGNASLLLTTADQPTAERLADIVGSAERAANLTRQLLAYSGKGQFVIQDVDVAEEAHRIGGLLESSIPKSVQLSVTAEARLPLVRMDPNQLQQILVNLVTNAGEAVRPGHAGRVTLTTATSDLVQPLADALGEELPPGRYVTITVRDTGDGIPPEALSRIFDPFFSTKFLGRGLGLSAVAGILRSSKGGITVETEPGRGCTFRVYLPAAVRHHRSLGSGAQQGRATVLVVDDEQTVRDFLEEVLTLAGHRVLVASNGREALAICEREPAIDVAVVDVLMPVMGAGELLPAMHSRWPHIHILLTSAFGEAEARRLSADYAPSGFIQKPYTARQIAAKVAEVLGIENLLARPHQGR